MMIAHHYVNDVFRLFFSQNQQLSPAIKSESGRIESHFLPPRDLPIESHSEESDINLPMEKNDLSH